MTKTFGPYVTRLVREIPITIPNPLGHHRLGVERRETWVFLWNDLDKLFGHLHELAQDPYSGFGFTDLQSVMAAARRQLEHRGAQAWSA